MPNISKQLQSKLWSSHIKDLDLKKDKSLITHRVLSYGDLDDIHVLFSIYAVEDLQRTFLANPMNIYTRAGLNFVKNFILDMENTPVEKALYVKTLY